MIFTSCFRISGHLPQAVAICRRSPKGWTGKAYRPLAPSWPLVKAGLPPEEFIRAYRAEVLDKLNPQKVLDDLGGDNFIMLCWEPPGQFCHRQVVAAWLKKELGLDVPEFNPRLRRHREWLREMQERRSTTPP
uniref:DUF488 domain-containing protein n=1 Tax=Desulfobacca acetoxidans TaxID=60893 RepID=A0A7C3SJ22_9BACT